MVLNQNVPSQQIFWRLPSISRRYYYMVALHFLTFPYAFAVGHLGKRILNRSLVWLDFTVLAFLPGQGGKGDNAI